MKHNKFKTNNLTTAASQDQSQKPQQEYVFSNLPVSGIQGQMEIKHTKFKTNKLITAACTKHSRKRSGLQKRVSCGVVLMALTMLHEKCCNTVLQIGAPRMMTVIVKVFGAFGLTVSEKKTETPLMRAPEKAQQPGETPTPPLPALEIAAAGQKYNQVHQLVYLGGLITEDADITRDINRRTKIAWGCFRKFPTEIFDRPSAPL